MNKNERFILLSSAFGFFLFCVDSSLMNMALPVISRYFKVGTSEVSFLSTAYLVTVSATLLMGAQLLKRFEFKKVLIFGYLLFFFATVLCGFSQNIWLLIFFRAIQGLGGSIMLIGSYAALPRYISQDRMGFSLGIMSGIYAAGMAAGFPIGGLLTAYFPWQTIFYIQIPFLVLGIWLVWKAFPKDTQTDTEKPFDIPGVMIFFIALSLVTFSLSMIENIGWKNPIILSGFLVSIFFFALFIIREKKYRFPFIDLTIFSNRRYNSLILGRVLVAVLQSGNLFLLPFYLKYALHLPQNVAGLILLFYSLFYIIFAPISGIICDRFNAARVCLVSLFTLLSASILFLIMAGTPSIYWIVLYLIVLASSLGLFNPANNKIIINYLPPEKRNISTGIVLTVWSLGHSLGVSVFELIFSNSLYFTKFPETGIKGDFSQISPEILLSAFRNSYLAGSAGVLLSIFLVIIAISRIKGKENTQRS